MSATDATDDRAQRAMPPSAQDRTERSQARSERWRLLRRRPGFIVGVLVLAFWVVCADRRRARSRRTAPLQTGLPAEPAAEPATTRSAPTRSAATCSRG